MLHMLLNGEKQSCLEIWYFVFVVGGNIVLIPVCFLNLLTYNAPFAP